MDLDGITRGRTGWVPGRLFKRGRPTVGGHPDGGGSPIRPVDQPRHGVPRRLPPGEKPHQPRTHFVGQPSDLDLPRLEPRSLDHVEHEPLDSVGWLHDGMHLSLGEPCALQCERRLADNRGHEHITRRVGTRQPHDVGVFT